MNRPPALGFCAYSGTGKTTLLTRLIPLLKQRGLRIGLVKHSHHDFDIDQPGKDSYVLRKAGAEQVLIASRQRWALMTEDAQAEDPQLAPLLERMDATRLDLILVEGFKHAAFAKIELHRPDLGKPLMFPDDADIIAVASDAPLSIPCPLPLLDINQPAAIAEFIIDRLPVLPVA